MHVPLDLIVSCHVTDQYTRWARCVVSLHDRLVHTGEHGVVAELLLIMVHMREHFRVCTICLAWDPALKY